MKTKEQLGGLYTACITAYDAAGKVDGAALQRVMERNLREGAAGFFVGGSSGECFLLTNPELIAFDGYDETMVAGMALGCVGSIGSTFNIMLPHYKKVFDAYKAGRGSRSCR